MWERVDLPGLISLVWYDMLVVRNRYSHTTTREEVLGKTADPAAEAAGQAAIDEDPLNMLATQSYLGEEYIVKRSAQTQHEAQAAFELFHKHFARYVSRIEEKAVSPNFLAEMRAEDAEQAASDRSESADRSRRAVSCRRPRPSSRRRRSAAAALSAPAPNAFVRAAWRQRCAARWTVRRSRPWRRRSTRAGR